jgi:selenocysteine lyase/cysteine desulfurase
MAQERSGAHLSWVPARGGVVELADYERLVDGRTLLVSATHGYYLNGFVQDVAAIARLAHEQGAWLFVDAYQTCGVVPIDVRAMDVDFLASGTLKYLMGTPGIAFLYVRQELIERLEPLVTGWFGRVNPFAFDAKRLDWSPTASRFDTGTPPLLSAYVSRASMNLLLEVGVRWIREWTEELSRHAVDGARARGLTLHGAGLARDKSPTTAILVRDSHAVEERLRARGVIASARGPVIRLAPHFYNTREEIDRALDLLAEEPRS